MGSLRDRMRKELHPVMSGVKCTIDVTCRQGTRSVEAVRYGDHVAVHRSLGGSRHWSVTLIPCGVAVVMDIGHAVAVKIAQQMSAIPGDALAAFGKLGKPIPKHDRWFKAIFHLTRTAALAAGGITLRQALKEVGDA